MSQKFNVKIIESKFKGLKIAIRKMYNLFYNIYIDREEL